MPDNQCQPSEDILTDCKELLWNTIAYFQDLEECYILLQIALEQFEKLSEVDTLKRVHLLLTVNSERSEVTLSELRVNLRCLCQAIRPQDLSDLPAERITPLWYG